MVIAETKLDSSFLDPQFFIDNYYKPTRKAHNSNSGGLMEFIKIRVLRKSLKDFSYCKLHLLYVPILSEWCELKIRDFELVEPGHITPEARDFISNLRKLEVESE